MSKIINDTYELLDSISQDLNAEDLQLAGLQGMIAAEISMKRQDMGLNQKQFASLMGVSQGLISKWEKGETNFTLETLVKIAVKLDISLQCPFVPRRPSSYYVGDNIVAFPGTDSWRTTRSSPSSYDILELEEM